MGVHGQKEGKEEDRNRERESVCERASESESGRESKDGHVDQVDGERTKEIQ